MVVKKHKNDLSTYKELYRHSNNYHIPNSQFSPDFLPYSIIFYIFTPIFIPSLKPNSHSSTAAQSLGPEDLAQRLPPVDK